MPQWRCNYAIPPLVQLLFETYFGWYLCLEVTSFKSTKISQILTLTHVGGPLNADANLKYELYISNNKRDNSKRTPPMVVQLCCSTNRWTPLLEFILVGFCATPPSRGVTDPSKYVPGHTGLVHPFSQLSRSVLLVRLSKTNMMSNKHYLL